MRRGWTNIKLRKNPSNLTVNLHFRLVNFEHVRLFISTDQAEPFALYPSNTESTWNLSCIVRGQCDLMPQRTRGSTLLLFCLLILAPSIPTRAGWDPDAVLLYLRVQKTGSKSLTHLLDSSPSWLTTDTESTLSRLTRYSTCCPSHQQVTFRTVALRPLGLEKARSLVHIALTTSAGPSFARMGLANAS